MKHEEWVKHLREEANVVRGIEPEEAKTFDTLANLLTPVEVKGEGFKGTCPTCGARIEMPLYQDEILLESHCPVCAQAIQWADK